MSTPSHDSFRLVAESLLRDEDRLRAMLRAADSTPLLMAMMHFGADESLLDEARPYIAGPWNYAQRIPDRFRERIVEEFVQLLNSHAAGTRGMLPLPFSLLKKMMSVASGDEVPDEYVEMLRADLAIDAPPEFQDVTPVSGGRFHVVVVGAGMSGICAGIKLKSAGIPFTVFERNKDVGGTWFENVYPGCGVDTPSHFYSYSFEPNGDWPHYFSKQGDILRYFKTCAAKHGIMEHVRLGAEVVGASYDAGLAEWTVTVRGSDGRLERVSANAVILAVGILNRPSLPGITGLEDFKGPVIHTARWDPAVQLTGRRVGLIGVGASAMQAGPTIAPEVEKLTVFQRSPHWIVPNPNYHAVVSEENKWALKHVPFYEKWYRFTLFWGFSDGLHASLQVDPAWPDQQRSINATNDRFRRRMLRYIEEQLGDRPELMAKVIPNYPPYGKRILIDNHWYQMLRRDNVELVTTPIDEVLADAVVSGGQRYPLDVLVMATGFQVACMLWPITITGLGGRTIRDSWGEDDPRAYLGITVPGFPNMFLLGGPNTFLGHGGNMIFNTECQMHYIMQCLQRLVRGHRVSCEVRQEVHDAYNERVDAALGRMLWSQATVSNWYKNSRGRVVANLPWRLVDYWRWTRKPEMHDYIVQDR